MAQKSGGTVANRAGSRLERFVSEKLDERGYRDVPPAQFYPARVLEQTIYTKQFEIGKSIYGKNRCVDLILYHPALWPECLCIQCKWQASSGSVEEKYPFEVLSIAHSDVDTIIILDGGGYSDGAKLWLINQAGKNRLKHVFNQGEFSRFVTKGRI